MATQKAKIVPIQIQKPNKDISKQVLTFSPSKIIFKVDQTKKEKSQREQRLQSKEYEVNNKEKLSKVALTK